MTRDSSRGDSQEVPQNNRKGMGVDTNIDHPDRNIPLELSEREGKVEPASFWKEVEILVGLAIPTIIVTLTFVIPPFLTASYVGRHFGHVYLDGYSLANLTGNLLTMAPLQGFFRASDTLSPQAFAAQNYREVGLLAIRGFVGTLLIIIPINAILYLFMGTILDFLGQDDEAASHAWHFYVIYALSLPFYSLYTITWKFLSAQNVMRPLVVCTLVSTCVVLPTCLEVFVRSIGFFGASLALTVFYIFQSVSVLAWLYLFKPHRPGTWPGLSAWREALEWKPFKAYLVLGVGGMLNSLEWIYWEALGLVVGSLGVLPLSAHTIPSQVIFTVTMFPMGIGIASSIRVGATMTHNVTRAKFLSGATLIVSFVIFFVISVTMYRYRYFIYSFFTNESEVIELCDEIWFGVCAYFLVFGCYAVNMGICTGLGMQWTFGTVTVLALWSLGMPGAYFFAVSRGGGLAAVWKCIWPPYMLINIGAEYALITQDWDKISASIRRREGIQSLHGGDAEFLHLAQFSELAMSAEQGGNYTNEPGDRIGKE